MPRTANLYATVTIYWVTKGQEHDAEVEVDYTFDGQALTITSAKLVGYVAPDNFDELVWLAVSDIADKAYAEDMADYGEYLSDRARDRMEDL